MRRYAEVHKGFVVGFHERDDMRRPEFSGRIAIRIDMLQNPPSIGDEWDGKRFSPPSGRPNPNLLPHPPSDRELLEQTHDLVQQILDRVCPCKL